MVIATGFFDGVHIGHRAVLSALCRVARSRGEESMAVTFWPHPRNVLQQDADKLRLLTTLQAKKELIRSIGVDRVEVIPFTEAFSHLTAGQFIKEYLIDRFGATALVLGYDHRLGGGPPMTREQLDDVVRSLGLDLVRAEEYSLDGKSVSSTQIRNLLSHGEIEAANEMLGYEYELHGVVVSGNKIGRKLGFPTANIELYEPLKLLPDDGVYVVRADVLGKQYFGMTNIGFRPTVASMLKRTIETNIFGFDSDIYGLDIHIRFISRIRSEVRFTSMDNLKKQLAADREFAEDYVKRISAI